MEILSNGSKWAGEQPDDLPTLINVLKNHKLDPIFMGCGRFFYKSGDEFVAFGNFVNISHVFRIRGTLKELHPLALALKENRHKYGIRRLPKN